MRRLVLFLVFLSAALGAGILPLIQDRPRRDNPNDPAVKPLSLPVAPVWTPTPTLTPTPSCGGADASGGGIITIGTFESSNDGFSQTSGGGYVLSNPLTSTVHCSGAKAFCGTANFTHGGIDIQSVVKKSYGSNQNWAGKTIKAWARFDPGMQLMSAQIYIQSNGFRYSNGPITHPAIAGGWSVVTFDLSQPAGTGQFFATLTDTTKIHEVGFQIFSNLSDPDGTFSFCVDDFRVE